MGKSMDSRYRLANVSNTIPNCLMYVLDAKGKRGCREGVRGRRREGVE